MLSTIVKIFLPSTMSFLIGIALTPFLTHYLYKYRLWKKKARENGLIGGTPIFNQLHKEKEVGTPRLGGIIIWASVLLTAAIWWILAHMSDSPGAQNLDFISRSETWLPFFTLIAGSLVGMVDDFLVIFNRGGYIAGGLPLSLRIGAILLIGLCGGWWFYVKLGISAILVPFVGAVGLGILFIPFFMLVMLAIFSGGVIDGIDGLSGGIFAAIFSAYAGIAFFQHQTDLAAFCAVVVGGILAFLWFNIPPARFYMSETGIMGLTTSITVVAFLTGQVAVLPIIALPLFLASGSVIIQVLSKKFRGKKVFLVAPLHHHFEALGWPGYKVTMRFWVLSVVCVIFGMAVALAGII